MGVGHFALRTLAVLTSLSMGTAALACASPASYRSVVVNTVPEQIPPEARVYRVRIDEALYDAERQEIMGIRGIAFSAAEGGLAGSQIEITGRLGAMCNTWYELWSGDHDIENGVLAGYIVGRLAGAIGERTVIAPMLYPAQAYRKPERDDGRWLSEIWALSRDTGRMMPSSGARWVTMRLDAEALAGNQVATDRLIREDNGRRADD